MLDSRDLNSVQGHRQRLKQRFLSGGLKAVADYELLELLLFYANPRKDMKPLAKKLINHFGNFSKIFSASIDDLKKIDGIGEHTLILLKAIQATALLATKQEIIKKPVFQSLPQLLDYCHLAMAHENKEQLRLFFLNNVNELISEEVQQTGTVDHTAVYPREIAKRALELNATGLIMVHNHPSGLLKPSKDDINITKEVKFILEKLNIILHDHLIITNKGHVSFAQLELLN
ncbi:MAG: DNA repair protein RadC [Alphaproteobacteria bacterium]|nr:DNA repair protein RadC [Alphaproteobacteria bacterium]